MNKKIETEIIGDLSILDLSYQNYSKIIEKKLPNKFEYLEKSLYDNSNKLLYESMCLQRYYHKFKRGMLIKVDFGVNLGCEFSQKHFAIVLSKNDKQESNLIAVLPLTSKNHNNSTLKLDNSILKSQVDLCNENLKKISKEIKKIEEEISEFSNRQKELLNFKLDKDDYKEIEDELFNLDEKIISISEKLEFQKNNINEILDIIKIYKNCKEMSYACIDQIKVISKTRIQKPKNKYDILEKLIWPQEVMRMIDFEIFKRYTGYNYTIFENIKDSFY